MTWRFFHLGNHGGVSRQGLSRVHINEIMWEIFRHRDISNACCQGGFQVGVVFFVAPLGSKIVERIDVIHAKERGHN